MGQIYQVRNEDNIFGDLQRHAEIYPEYRTNSREEQIGLAMQYLQDQIVGTRGSWKNSGYNAEAYSHYLQHGDAFGQASPEEQNRILHSLAPEDEAIFMAHNYSKLSPEEKILATRAYDDMWASELIGRSAMSAEDPAVRERSFNTLMQLTAGNPYLGPEPRAYANPIGPEVAGFVGPVAYQKPPRRPYSA